MSKSVVVPPAAALRAIDQGYGTAVRRVEIYESDGETPWVPNEEVELQDDRFVAGSVNIDYSRDERRTLDLTLRNDDGILHPNPINGIWYDKVFKLYRGIKYPVDISYARIVIISEPVAAPNVSVQYRQILTGAGFKTVDINLAAATWGDVSDYDIIVSIGTGWAPLKTDLLKQAYTAGKSIITTGNDTTTAHLPFATASSATSGSISFSMNPVSGDIPIAKNWTNENSSVDTGQRITAVDSTAIPIATSVDGATTFYTAILAQNDLGGRWFHYHLGYVGAQGKIMWNSAAKWLAREDNTELGSWETQVGEYVIDNLSTDSFPSHLKIVGRDYTKRCMNSKLARATSFESGSNVMELISALASNSGIRKMKLPIVQRFSSSQIDYAPQTSRWQIMKELAASINSDIYFDHAGYLVVEPYADPAFSPEVATFQTGQSGNLVKYTRSASDSELYNHIVITSGSDNEANALPYFGEAINSDPDSPTNVDRIGDRTYFWDSVSMGSDEACVALAKSWLKIYALESFEMSFDSINYFWLDAGGIAKVLDPDRIATDPTRFLMTSLTIPMTLGPMQAAARRMMIVEG